MDESLRTRIEALVRAGTVRRKIAAVQLEAEIRRREEVMRQTFRRYVSPRLADKILEDAQLRDTLLSTADVRTHAVVLFADLRGFTSISERLEPHEVVPLLNEYFSLLTEITFRHDGTVFHMAGDCLMLGFGVPLEQPDSPQRAVRAAQEMLVQLRRARPLLERALPDRGRPRHRHQRRRRRRRQHRLDRLHELHDHRRHGEHRRPPLPAGPRRRDALLH